MLFLVPYHKAHDLLTVQDNEMSMEGHEQRLQDIVTFVVQHSGAALADKLGSQVHFKVPTECEFKLSAFFRQLKVCLKAPPCLARLDQLHELCYRCKLVTYYMDACCMD